MNEGEKRATRPPSSGSLAPTVTSTSKQCARSRRSGKHVGPAADVQRAQQAEEEALPGEAPEG